MFSTLVVTSKTVNTGFDENQTELGVTILSVTFKMLSDSDSLLDEEIHIFRKRGSETYSSNPTEWKKRKIPFFLRSLRILEPVTALT